MFAIWSMSNLVKGLYLNLQLSTFLKTHRTKSEYSCDKVIRPFFLHVFAYWNVLLQLHYKGFLLHSHRTSSLPQLHSNVVQVTLDSYYLSGLFLPYTQSWIYINSKYKWGCYSLFFFLAIEIMHEKQKGNTVGQGHQKHFKCVQNKLNK